MRLWKKSARAGGAGGLALAEGGGAGKAPRRMERHAAKGGMRSSLGRTLDLSGGGACIHVDRVPALKVQQAVPLELFLLGGSETVNARVCWIRRRGLLKPHWEVGLKFIAVPAAQAKRLDLIARNGFLPAEADEPEAPKEAAVAPRAEAGMLALREHFEALQLPAEATADDVRAAHRKLVRVCHPDVASGPEAQADFLRLQASYQVLIDAFRERETRLADAA